MNLSKRQDAAFSKMRLNRVILDVRALVLKRLTHFRTKPCVMGLAGAQELDRKRPLSRRPGQQDANSIGNGHTHIFQDDRSAISHFGVDPRLHQRLGE